MLVDLARLRELESEGNSTPRSYEGRSDISDEEAAYGDDEGEATDSNNDSGEAA